jgi:hypothetical protein
MESSNSSKRKQLLFSDEEKSIMPVSIPPMLLPCIPFLFGLVSAAVAMFQKFNLTGSPNITIHELMCASLKCT